MALDFEKYRGLTANEVITRQKKLGLNILFKKKRKGLLDYILRIFNEPMLILLLITALIYFSIDQAGDGILMLVGVLFIIGIDLYQEAKTDKALEALKELSTPKINVIRDGRMQTINNRELVAGDLLVVREGERVAGDGMILESSNFSVDESILTGESGAIFKGKIP
ncbi:MAG: cation-transporting P-type ATPase, partial [Elusimicrobiota bacterium]